ncbi:alpha beta hydrolase fold-1 [Stemphylium lycopersici]|nr:alpha beta hydrolase fold-1 [Stemphylium lycopersici]
MDSRHPFRSSPDNAAVTTKPATQTLRSRRRDSLPLSIKTSDALPGLRSPNYIRTTATSPQIISSLIDQLSAISIPANNHFENLLINYNAQQAASAAPSVRTHSSERNSITGGHDGNAADQSNYYDSLGNDDDLYPDDACEPPVIRTSKPPSGKSPLTAPKKASKSHSISSYIGRSGGSSCSLQSVHSNRSASSFGNISVEAGPARQVSADSNRSSVESKRSVKAHKSLMYMSSRERLRQKETERKRVTVHSFDDIPTLDSPRKTTAQLFPYEDTIKEEPTSAREDARLYDTENELTRFAQRYPSRNHSPRRIRLNLVDGPHGESPAEQGLIPERGSSLKHTGSPGRKGKKRRPEEKSRHKSSKTSPVPEEAEKMVPEDEVDPEAQKKKKILEELEQEENEVARRIRQLQERKLQRDKLAGHMPADEDAGGTPPRLPRVSSIPSPESSPATTVSNVSEDGRRVRDYTKAHKVLGISHEIALADNSAVRSGGKPTEGESADKLNLSVPPARTVRPRPRSLTLNAGEDITHLPFEYTLALQCLGETAPIPPLDPRLSKSSAPPSIASKTTVLSSDSVPKRSNSLAVGGRSAVSRRAATSAVIMTKPPGHKHSSSVTDGTSSRLAPPSRAASEEPITRHRSMHASPLPDSHSVQLQRKRTGAKKRWSHPDLPAKAEKEHNDKVERKEELARASAVQSPSYPTIEERPASLDSIDLDVHRYLGSERLSQKIRHPQTGRIISFSEVGDPQGFAVFVCVGMGLTRFVMAFYDQLAATLKLRLITPDRPGIGGSQVDPNGTPLSWPALKINKFSMLAHSAGAVYALATSLRMPQHIRGRVHLLAPWIPPSQMAPIGISQDSPPTQQLPRSQRFLRALPPSLLKVANSTFLSATSASLQRTGPKTSPKTRRKSTAPSPVPNQTSARPSLKDSHRHSMMMMDQVLPNASSLTLGNSTDPTNQEETQRMQEMLSMAERERQRAFDERLTFAIWDRATAHANPATDLIVCLETKQTIGFRYEDINRPVVIHHGSKDSRVPVDNVRWLGKLMRKCEVRILEGEQHGLMASAQVMGNVLTEMASDWEDWTNITTGKGASENRSVSRRRTTERLKTQISFSG